MSGAVSASTVAMMGMAAVGGMAMASAMTPNVSAKVAPVTQADKPPQAAKAPDRNAIAGANAAAAAPGGALAGNSSTFLTGPNGIDPSALNLGKNTLLGQ